MSEKSTTDTHPPVLWFKILPPDAMGDIPLTPLNPDYKIDKPVFLGISKRHKPNTGDHVLARLTLDDDDTYQAHILHLIVPKAQTKAIGIIHKDADRFYFHASVRARKPLSFPLDASWLEKNQIKDGALVALTLAEAPNMHDKNAPIIEDYSLLCQKNEPHALTYLTLAHFQIEPEFPSEIVEEAEQLKAFATIDKKRTDLTHLPFVTIDGADAKDFDDAVYAEHDKAGNSTLYVAIADVSHYVLPNSMLDKEAAKRGNSVYLPDMAVPMLPEILSNDLCSLRMGELRPVMVVKFPILEDGMIGKSEIFRAAICSKARLTYEQAEEILQKETDHSLHPHLKDLSIVYHKLLAQREKRGAIDLERVEYKIHFDKDFLPTDIKATERLESHKIIEEAMIAANVAVAKFLTERLSGCVYRIHDAPPKDKAEELRLTAVNFGIKMPKQMGVRSKDYQQLLQRAKGEDFYEMLANATLRSQSQAVYATDNIGHFGLALQHYCHFTSPIRRYADLLVHRAIEFCLNKGQEQPMINDEICVHISATERNAQKCEYACFDRYSALLLEQHLDEEMVGTITYVGSAGLFVTLDALHAEGFVPARFLLPQRNIGRNQGRRDDRRDRDRQGGMRGGDYLIENFAPQEKITVKIIEANALTGSCTFAPAQEKPSKDREKGKPRESQRKPKTIKNPKEKIREKASEKTREAISEKPEKKMKREKPASTKTKTVTANRFKKRQERKSRKKSMQKLIKTPDKTSGEE